MTFPIFQFARELMEALKIPWPLFEILCVYTAGKKKKKKKKKHPKSRFSPVELKQILKTVNTSNETKYEVKMSNFSVNAYCSKADFCLCTSGKSQLMLKG